MGEEIARHFATVGNRQVHYRRVGRGPPVVLLHEAPRSSAAFEPLMRQLAARHTVIAPDTPGNGLSEPLGIERPRMSDFARGLVEFLDVVGIPRCVLYGYHTGAACALEVARRYPARIARTVVNGYLQVDPAFRADMLAHYFAPLSIDWSGSHLAWLWARMQEQWSFFPWYRKTLAFRPPLDPPGPQALHAAVLEMLDAGDAYRDSYYAAFEYDSAATVQQLEVPTLVTTARDDVLFPSLALMPRPAACVRVRPAEDLAQAEAFLQAELAVVAESLPEPPPARTTGRASPWSAYVRTAGRQLHVRQFAAGSGRPAIVQHSSLESAHCVERLVTALAAQGPAFALDLPGRGLSDGQPADEASGIEVDAESLSHGLRTLGIVDAAFVGWRGGASVGLELAGRRDPAVHHLVALQPAWPLAPPAPAELARLAPEFTPDGAGTQFLRAWHMLRNQELYAPWYERRLASMIRHHEPDLAPEITQRRLQALFRCGRTPREYLAASLGYPAYARLAQCPVPVLLADAAPDIAADARAAGGGSRCRSVALPQNDFAAQAAALAGFDRSLA